MADKKDFIDGKITFYGFYIQHRPDKRSDIVASTQQQYKRNYTEVLEPKFRDKPLEDYNADDIHARLVEIKAHGKQRTRNKQAYADATMGTFRANLKKLLDMAVDEGYCAVNAMDDLDLADDADKEDHADFVDEMITLRKSLTVKEEKLVFDEVFREPRQAGEKMGVALMFAFGLRNAEACAVCFSDIKEMVFHPGHYYLEISKTVVGNTTDVKQSGKTANANRLIPMTKSTYDFLMARKSYVQKELSNAPAGTTHPDSVADDYPIACDRKNFSKRCTTQRLSNQGKAVLKKASLDMKVIQYIQQDHSTALLEEKEPTAYLFRRNFATQLYVLGLNPDEIQFVIGHQIENTQNLRNFYTNEEKLYPIKLKMDRRPLFCGDIPDEIAWLNAHSKSRHSTLLASGHTHYGQVFLSAERTTLVQLNLHALEPNDDIILNIRSKSPIVEVTATITDCPSESPQGPVNITKEHILEYGNLKGNKGTAP